MSLMRLSIIPNEYIVLIQRGEDELDRSYYFCDAKDSDDAQQQALDFAEDVRVIAVFERVA